MKFLWSVAAANPLLTGSLARQLNISPTLAQCLLNRGLTAETVISDFLDPRLKNLSDPFQLPDMGIAVDRLFRAHAEREPVTIFGDYDVDGVTSVTLLLQVFRELGWLVHYYLPHRLEEGYGLSHESVVNCLRKVPSKIILAVDCGSTSFEPIAWLRKEGVDVLVLDHHQISNPPPPALALINPHRLAGGNHQAGAASSLPAEATGQPHANTGCVANLCSVGLAFKLAHAVIKRGREVGLAAAANYDLRPLLDLVALGTIADVVPLTGENRILVSAGLERLNQTRRPGLVALKQVAQSPALLGPMEVGYQLGPRLNAAGRLETAEDALRLLLAGDLQEAIPLAQTLDSHNRERQKLERTMAEQALALVRPRFNPEEDYVIVQGDALWHIGVAGIVASRMVQQFYRPTIIVGGSGEEWRGSGRSIEGFDLAAALRECADLLSRHGGHAMAAGVSITPKNLEAFRLRLNHLARTALAGRSLQPPLRLDAEVTLREITFDWLAHLDQLKPVGQGNPPVQFFVRNVSQQKPLQRMGALKQHVKLWITDGVTTHEAVWWNGGAESLPVGRFDLAFAPQINEYNGRRSVQLKVLDWRASQERGML